MRGAAVLFVVCLGLGALIVHQLMAEPGGIVASAALLQPEASRPSLPEIKEPRAAAYGHIVDANLFDPARRPTPELVERRAPAKPRAQAGRPAFELKGVITTPQGRHALVRLRRERQYRQVVKGEEVEGWVVQSIGADRISVKKAGTALVLELEAPKPAVQRPAPRRKAPADRERRQR